MTKTEVTFQRWYRKNFPRGYIVKLPDFKVGATGIGGLPDYMTINKEVVIFYEVKSAFGDTITMKHFTDGQKITFMKMFAAGADIKIYCFTKTKGRKIINYIDLLKFEKIKFK